MDTIRTLKEALYNTIHHHPDLSVEAIAEELNMAPSYLARAALPDADMDEVNGTGVRFPLKQLIPLIRTTGDFQSLNFIEHTSDDLNVTSSEAAVQAIADTDIGGDIATGVNILFDDGNYNYDIGDGKASVCIVTWMMLAKPLLPWPV